MNDYLEWLAAGLIFLLVLGTYDARATPGTAAAPGSDHAPETHLRPSCPSRNCMSAPDSSACRLLPQRRDPLTAIWPLLHPNREPGHG